MGKLLEARKEESRLLRESMPMNQPQVKGRIVEHLVAAKLLEVGFTPAKPLFEMSGVDFVLFSKWKALRLEVKGMFDVFSSSGGSSHQTNLRQSNQARGKEKKKILPFDLTDFIICYEFHSGSFLVIPIFEVGSGGRIDVSWYDSGRRGGFWKFESRWDLIKARFDP